MVQPPCANPLSRSSSWPPGAWMTPSRVMNCDTTSFLMVISFLWGLRRGPSACLHQNDERGERRSTTAPRRAHNSMELRSFAPSALETDDVDVGPGGLDRAAAPGVTQGLAVSPAGAAAADGVGDAAGR